MDDEHIRFTREAAALVSASLRSGGRLLICGNGGSAADGMHLAAEFVGRFERERQGLSAINLADRQSVLTCVANDDDFDQVFARGVQAHGRAGDVLLAITTSGTSPNVLAAVAAARERSLAVIGMTGAEGERLAGLRDADPRGGGARP